MRILSNIEILFQDNTCVLGTVGPLSQGLAGFLKIA